VDAEDRLSEYVTALDIRCRRTIRWNIHVLEASIAAFPIPQIRKTDPCAGAYSASRPTTFSRTQGDPGLDVNQFEYGTFFQSDWKMTQKFNLSWAPVTKARRTSATITTSTQEWGFAYQLAKTTALREARACSIRGSTKIPSNSYLRLDGTRQEQIVIRYPTFCLDLTCLNFSGMGTSNTPPSLRVRAPELVTPYNINTSLSLEKSLPKGLGLTFHGTRPAAFTCIAAAI